MELYFLLLSNSQLRKQCTSDTRQRIWCLASVVSSLSLASSALKYVFEGTKGISCRSVYIRQQSMLCCAVFILVSIPWEHAFNNSHSKEPFLYVWEPDAVTIMPSSALIYERINSSIILVVSSGCTSQCSIVLHIYTP